MSKRKNRTNKASSRFAGIAWPQVLGEVVLVALVLVVPVVINKNSRNIMDVKEVVLGLGAAFGLALWLVAGLARRRLSWASSRLNSAVLIYAAWAAISIAYSGRYWWVSLSEFARLAAHIALFWLAICSLRTTVQVRRVIGAACVAAVPIAVYAFMQKAGMDFIDWKTSSDRAFSFLGNPTYLAGFLILVIPMAIAIGWPRRESPQNEDAGRVGRWPRAASVLAFASVLLMLICLYFSVTLSAIIGLALGGLLALLLVLIRGGAEAARRAFVGLALLMLVLAPIAWLGYQRLPASQQERARMVLHLRDPYAAERSLHWRVALDIFRQRPLIGQGYGTFQVYSLERMASQWYQQSHRRAEGMLVPRYAHNEYLQVLAGTGLVGGITFAILLVAAYGLAFKIALKHPDEQWRRLGLGVIAGMTAFLFQNFFGITFRQTGSVTFFWLSLALLVVASAWLPRDRPDEHMPRVRELRLPPVSTVRLALVALALAGALAVLAWVTIRPVLASVALRQAQAAAAAGDYPAAERLSQQALVYSPHTALAYYVLAFAQGQMNQLEKAVAASEKALALLPGNASAHYNLGVTYTKLGRFEEAERNFREAVRLQPTALLHQAAMAEVLVAQGRFDEAEVYARKTVELAPENPDCHLLLAEIASRKADLPATLEHLRQAARFGPNDVNIQRQLAELLLRMNRSEEAEPFCRRWVELDPNSDRAYRALGTCFFNRGDYAAAKTNFLRALQIKPRNVTARLNLAWTYGRLRNFDAAVRELRRVAQDHPRTPEGKEAKQFLEQSVRPAPPRKGR